MYVFRGMNLSDNYLGNRISTFYLHRIVAGIPMEMYFIPQI